jgi:hypothetical protein
LWRGEVVQKLLEDSAVNKPLAAQFDGLQPEPPAKIDDARAGVQPLLNSLFCVPQRCACRRQAQQNCFLLS